MGSLCYYPSIGPPIAVLACVESVQDGNQALGKERKTSAKVKEFYEKFGQDMEKMKKSVPGTIKGFGGLFQGVMKDSVLKTKEKELIALGIATA
jgi:alkylhydroperoxidase/carboxymuconolactone decarboxylase family protein YurZ